MSASQEQVQKMLGNKNNLSELKSRIWFVIVALVIYRLGTFIPVPGVNPSVLAQMLESQSGGLLDMFNMFSGGALEPGAVPKPHPAEHNRQVMI